MMRRTEAWLLNISVTVVALTGLALYVMKEWLEPSDPFSVVGHPWQPAMLKIHLATVPVLIFTVGLVFASHVLRKLDSKRRGGRRSGIGMVALFVPMVLSGVLIQMLVSDTLLAVAVWTHLLTGVLFAAGFMVHALSTPRSAGARRAEAMRAEDPFLRSRSG